MISMFFAGGYFCTTLPSSKRLVIFFGLMPKVELLCSRAEAVGGRMPATPSTISDRLKPTIKR